MSKILNSENFGSKIYNKFPTSYKIDDIGTGYSLKRFIESLSEGGFKYSIDEINGLLNLIDPQKTDEKVLPILFKQYGLEIFNGIPDRYLRYLLPRLGEAWSKKGSLSVVDFITSSLSGIKTHTNVNTDSKGNPMINVTFEMDYNMGDYFPNMEQFNRILNNFIPFYCDIAMFFNYVYDELGSVSAKEEAESVITFNNIIDEVYTILSRSYTLFAPQTNLEDKVLSNTIILSEVKNSSIDTDSFVDLIRFVEEDNPTISSVEYCEDIITVNGETRRIVNS